MADRLVQHKHCPTCGKAMSTGKETCSSECATSREVQTKSRKRTLYVFYASMVILVVVLALQLMGGL